MLISGRRLNDVLHKIMRKFIASRPAHESSRYAASFAEVRFPRDDSFVGIVNVERDLHGSQRRTVTPGPLPSSSSSSRQVCRSAIAVAARLSGNLGAVEALPAEVATAVNRYLNAVDDAAPGVVEGVYVTGSVALGDYRPGISDIDLVAVSREALSPAVLEALAELHEAVRERLDVVYATDDDLKRDPAALSLPCSVNGAFQCDGAFDANPILWRTLSTRAISVRGMPLTRNEVWFDADALRRWNIANMDSYWADWLEWARNTDGTEDRVRFEYGLQWLVLGVPRLHYTIATLNVVSKTAAGHYAREVAPPQWHVVLDAAIALRADRDARLPAPADALWRDAIKVSTWFIDDAHRLVNSVATQE